MAISLSNHEDRIKKLEEYSGSYSETTLYSGSSATTVTLSQSIDNFDAVVIMTQVLDSSGDCRFIPKSLYNRKHCLEFAYKKGESCVTPSGNKVVVNYNWGGSNTTKILAVVGLKLYYSFSYNIIYKELETMLNHFLSFLRGDTLWRYHHQA